MERNIRLIIAYDGTEFHGWQRQPGQRTVQGEIEAIARRVARHPVNVRGSGRTDAGVHARGQCANFITTCTIPTENLRRAMQSRLPRDVSLRRAEIVHPDFVASADALSKLYRYRIHNARNRPVDRLAQHYVYHCWHELDVERMRRAARHFVGEMDFSAMAGAGCVRETMVRRVIRCEVHRRYEEIRVDVEGTGFLYNQVRNMVGTLIEIGRGRWQPDRLAEILASKDRRQAGPTAPAQGLCLQWVRYPAERLRVD
jgi:tRNA pseudouridine38-40 synthase